MNNESAASRLISKLYGLELDEDEATLLSTVFRLANGSSVPEVQGLGMETALDPFAGSLFPSRGRHTDFKGTDEELQIVDWLGSLELRG